MFEPDWRSRPWPPSDKDGYSASDDELLNRTPSAPSDAVDIVNG